MAKELCRNCNREIDSSQRFCIHCGEKIVSQNDEGNLSKETRNEEKITELSNKIVQLSERLDLISNQLSEISSKGLKEAESVPKPTIESQESEEDYIVCKNCGLKFGEANLFCVHCGVKVSDIEESKENKSPELIKPVSNTENTQVESKIGINWLTIGGAILLVLAAVIFLVGLGVSDSKIPQIIFSCIFGSILMLIGYFPGKRYGIWGDSLIGAGLAAWYVSIYAGSVWYDLPFFSVYNTLPILTIIAGFSWYLSIKRNSIWIALLGLVGAIITPTIFFQAVEISYVFVLIAYLVLLDLAVLAISFSKNWKWFNYLSILGSYAYLTALNTQMPGFQNDAVVFTICYSIVFLVFVGVITVLSLRRHDTDSFTTIPLSVINVVLFYVPLLVGFLQEGYTFSAALLTLVLFGLYASFSIWFQSSRFFRRDLAVFYLMKAFGFLTISIPLIIRHFGIEFSGESMLTILWSVLASVVILSGALIKDWRFRAYGFVLLLIAMIYETFSGILFQDGTRLFSSLSWLISSLVIVCIYLVFNSNINVVKEEKNIEIRWLKEIIEFWRLIEKYIPSISLSLFHLVLFLGTTSELAYRLSDALVPITLAWISQGFILGIYPGILLLKNKIFLTHYIPQILRYAGFILLCVGVIKFMFVDISVSDNSFLIITALIIGGLIVTYSLSLLTGWKMFVLKSNDEFLKEEFKYTSVAIVIILALVILWSGSRYLWGDATWQQLSLTLYWAIYALVGVGLGVWKQNRYLRLSGLGFFLVPIGKLFLYDIWQLGPAVVWIAFLGLGIVLLITGLTYQRFQDRIQKFIRE